MSKMKPMLLLGVLLMLGGVAHAEDAKWLCVAEMATGFAYENGHWGQVNFVPRKKFVISKESGHNFYSLKDMLAGGSLECIKPNPESVWFRCDHPWGFEEFKFNTKHLRYTRTYTAGYAEGDEVGNTPLIELGTCSTF